jgi:hypothetical protein
VRTSYLTTLGKKSSRNLPKNLVRPTRTESVVAHQSAGERQRCQKSHRKHREFRHDKTISGISNDMRELEAGDSPALRFAYGAPTVPDSVYKETWRIITLGGADV